MSDGPTLDFTSYCKPGPVVRQTSPRYDSMAGVLSTPRFRLTASAYLPGAAAVGVEQRIRAVLADRLPESDPTVRVALTDQVTVAFTMSADEKTFYDRGVLQIMNHPDRKNYAVPTWPVRHNGAPPSIERAPFLGEHSVQVLGSWLGLSEREIDGLAEQKVISRR